MRNAGLATLTLAYSLSWHLSFSDAGMLAVYSGPVWLPKLPGLGPRIELPFNIADLTDVPDARRDILTRQVGGLWSQENADGVPAWVDSVDRALSPDASAHWHVSLGAKAQVPLVNLLTSVPTQIGT